MTAARSLSVFFPMHDEEGNVEQAVAQALEVLPGFGRAFEVIVVNDGSSDRTGELADALAAKHPEVRVVHHPRNRGYGGAVKSGFAAARHDLVFFTDGDLQFDLRELAPFLEAIERYDVVVGRRLRRAEGFRRSLNTLLWNALVNLLFGLRIRDVDCAFKLFRRDALERIGTLETEGAMLSTELLFKLRRAGANLHEIGVHHYPRPVGDSSGANPSVILRAFRELFRFYRRERHWRPAAPSSSAG